MPAGAEILVVTPGLCGEEAGLQAGDIVTQINDTTVSNGSDLINAVANYSPGDTVTLHRLPQRRDADPPGHLG